LRELEARCEQVFAAGLSMGGLITLRLAARLSSPKSSLRAGPVGVGITAALTLLRCVERLSRGAEVLTSNSELR